MTIDFDNPMQPDGMAAGPLSLLEFARRISSAVNTNPGLRGAWVVAELSDLNRHPTGHCYMELIQKDEQTGAPLHRPEIFHCHGAPALGRHEGDAST